MSTARDGTDEAQRDDVNERAGGRAVGRGAPREGAELLLVADRTRGSTHRFFRGWRFAVVAGAGHAAPGTPLFASPIDLRALAAAGRRYELVRLDDRPGFFAPDTAAFSWAAMSPPGPPDPLAAALGRARAWLAAGGWQQDPSTATQYGRPRRGGIAPPA